MDRDLFTVGELSEMTGVSKQTIRYYDKIGLLRPGKVGDNAYRYYGPMHVLYLNAIMRLKQLGCSLEETRQYISGRDLSDVRGMLEKRRSLTQKTIEELQRGLDALEEQIGQIEAGVAARAHSGVWIKRLPQRHFIYIDSDKTPDLKLGIMQIGKLVRRLYSLGLLYVGSPVFEYVEGRLRTGYFLPKRPDGFKMKTVPAGDYACIAHTGVYANMGQTLKQLKDFMAKNNLPVLSNTYQLFLIDYALTQNDNELLTELQVLTKKSS